jgi:hypothetical protein
MAVTPTEAIATLEAAMAQGVREVEYSDGRRVRYASQTEMERTLAYFRAQQRAANSQPSVGVSIGAFHRS